MGCVAGSHIKNKQMKLKNFFSKPDHHLVMHNGTRVLFVLKERFYGSSEKSYGLINSAKKVEEFLNKYHFECDIVTVTDGNDIDREVFKFKPHVVILEALWVTPEKVKELMELPRYRHINWIVRIHSDIAFLAAETNAMGYINGYLELKGKSKHNYEKLHIAFNDRELAENMSTLGNFMYLPNIVEVKHLDVHKSDSGIINIGCFGATRLLKNQLFQALCAINFADAMGRHMNFHVTVECTSKKDPVLTNLINLFDGSYHTLIIHNWMSNDDFQNLIQKMDFGMQLSFTESFNIVSAEFVNNDKLILVSNPIRWMPDQLKTSTNNYSEVINKLIYVYKNRDSAYLKNKQRAGLNQHNIRSKQVWLEELGNLK
jgi:hypothetical protein